MTYPQKKIYSESIINKPNTADVVRTHLIMIDTPKKRKKKVNSY